MRTYHSLSDVPYDKQSVITVGTFDGVHQGHRAIIERVCSYARENNARSVLVTFEPHPRLVLSRSTQTPISLLTTVAEKHALLQQLGINVLVIHPFTFEFAQNSAVDFIALLINQVGVKHFVIGHNHSFGKDRQGDETLLQQLADEYGFTMEVVPPVSIDNQIVSSTKIRTLLIDGNIELANRMLGYTYSLEGIVVHGDGRGRRLGYPTANIELLSLNKLLPCTGVYCISTAIDGIEYRGMANIGVRPTFTDSPHLRLEAHFFDYSGYLYDRKIVIRYHKFVRPERRFESVDMFWSQLRDDRECCEHFFSSQVQ